MSTEPVSAGLGHRSRAAHEARAFRPRALARRGRVSSVSASLASPSASALMLAWGLAALVIALALVVIFTQLDWRDLLRSMSAGS